MAQPPHVASLFRNTDEVIRLVEIHTAISGATPGRKHKVEVLNRSGIVLVVACWEAFVEDLAQQAFEWMLAHASKPTVFPARVLALASKELREHLDETKVWQLAGTGWQAVLRRHRDKVLKESIGKLNTPKPDQVDGLFERLIGLKKLSALWRWKGMPAPRARENLSALVERRGEIAHRLTGGTPVRKKDVTNAIVLVLSLAQTSSNGVADFVDSQQDSPVDSHEHSTPGQRSRSCVTC